MSENNNGTNMSDNNNNNNSGIQIGEHKCEKQNTEIKKENEEVTVEENGESKNVDEKTQLQLVEAVLECNIDTIVSLLNDLKANNMDIDFRYQEDGLTLLQRSILQGSFEITKILVEMGSEVNVPNLSGLSALHLAAQMGDLQTLTFLIGHSADLMQRDFENKISLHHAVLGGNLECVDILLSPPKGILINHRDNMGCSALHLAARKENKEMVVMLINYGADPVLFDNFGNRPIDLVPNFSRFQTSSDSKLSPQGKKTVAALKKKGGNKRKKISTSELRSSGDTHRSPTLTAPRKLTPHTHSSPMVYNAANKVKTENDVQKLYYSPRHNSIDMPLPDNIENNIPHKKLDKYGFYSESSQSGTPLSKENSKRIMMEEKKALKWLELMKNWDPKKSTSKKILKYCDRGIPDSVRGVVWRLLADCDEEAANSDVQYGALLQRDSTPEVKEQIHKDLHRTMPNHILFEEKGQGRQMLTNVLTAYSIYKPEIGYCQGMGFITAMFLMFMPEEDAFWMLGRVAKEYRFEKLWDMSIVNQCIYATENIFDEILPDIKEKLNEYNIFAASYIPQFFITGYLYNLPFSFVVRIWDSFLPRKFDFLYAIALGLFKVSRQKIMTMSMEEVMMLTRFKDCGEDLGFTYEQLLKCSLSVFAKINSANVRKLEEEGGRKKDEERREREERRKQLAQNNIISSGKNENNNNDQTQNAD